VQIGVSLTPEQPCIGGQVQVVAREKARRRKVVSRNDLAICALFLSLLAGRYSLTRVLPIARGQVLAGPALAFLLIAAILSLRPLAVGYGSLCVMQTGFVAWLSVVIAFHGYLIFSTTWSVSPQQGGEAAGDLLLVIAALLLLPLLFSKHRLDRLRLVLSLQIAAGLVYSTGGFLSYDTGRMAAFGGGPNVFARVVLSGTLASAFMWVRTRQSRWLLLAMPMLLAGLASGSRGALAGFAAACVAGLVLLGISRKSTWRRMAVVAFVGIVVLALLTWPLGATIGQLVSQRFVVLTLQQGYTSGRDRLVMESIQVYRANALVGVGLGGFRVASASQRHDYPHNLVLHAAAEGGTLGLVLLAVALGPLVLRSRRSMPVEQKAAGAIAMLYLVASMFSGDIYDARFLWFFACLYMLPLAKADARMQLTGVAARARRHSYWASTGTGREELRGHR